MIGRMLLDRRYSNIIVNSTSIQVCYSSFEYLFSPSSVSLSINSIDLSKTHFDQSMLQNNFYSSIFPSEHFDIDSTIGDMLSLSSYIESRF